MVRPRDSQRQRVYDAENYAFGGILRGKKTKRLMHGEDYRLLNFREFKEEVSKTLIDVESKNFRVPILKIGDGRGRRCAVGGPKYMKFPRWARLQWIVAHELSHSILTYNTRHQYASHGPEFIALYMELITLLLGNTASESFVDSLTKHKVTIGVIPTDCYNIDSK